MTLPFSRRVLVLDDDQGILSLLAASLKDLPIHLIECSELEAGAALLDSMRFGVLIADLEVSELGGLEGMRLIRHAVTNFPGTRVVIFSGHVSPVVKRLAASLHVTEILEKPGDLRRLVELVRVLTTDPFSAPAPNSHRLSVVEPLERVIEERKIVSLFQPIFALGGQGAAKRPLGFEALSRGPAGSPLQDPLFLFDYAVRKERVLETDLLCMERALSVWNQRKADARLFLNVHPRALSHVDFVMKLDGLLDRCGVPHPKVTLELTEQAAIVDARALSGSLDGLRRKGVQVALDDFGEGSSNLHLVHDLRPEFLKISGRFCEGIEDSPAKRAIVRSAVALSQDMNMKTIMERIENEAQLEAVAELGIDFAQGYHLGRPSEADRSLGPSRKS